MRREPVSKNVSGRPCRIGTSRYFTKDTRSLTGGPRPYWSCDSTSSSSSGTISSKSSELIASNYPDPADPK